MTTTTKQGINPAAVECAKAMRLLERDKKVPDKEDYGDPGAFTEELDALFLAFQEDGIAGYEAAKKSLLTNNAALDRAYSTTAPEGDQAGADLPEGQKLGPKGAPVFVTYSEDDIAALPDVKWLVADILQKQTVSLLAATGNTGKTFLALDLAMHIARGMPWIGHRIEQGTVLYIYGEGRLGLRKRLQAWRDYYNESSSPNIRFIPHAIHLRDQADVLRQTVDACDEPPAFIIVDTFSICASDVKENDNTEVARCIKTASEIKEKYGSHVMIVHHTNKASGGIRGASAFRDNVDTALYLERTDPQDIESPIRLHCDKQRDGGFFADHFLKLHPIELGTTPYGEPITSCVLVEANNDDVREAKQKGSGLAVQQERALIALGDDELTNAEWLARAQELGVKPRTFSQAIDALITKGLVEVIGVKGKRGARFRKTRPENTTNGQQGQEAGIE